MKKIKIIGENIIKNLIESFKNGRVDENVQTEYKCHEVKDWLKIHENCPPLYFHRNWDERKNPRESGASFIFHDTHNINVISVMEDNDVFSDAAPINDRTWEKGDVLEFFIQPPNSKSYFELHVAPNLATLQLAIPDANDLKNGKYKFEDLFADTDAEFGADKIETNNFKGWWGLICIPAEKNGFQIKNGHFANFAACRYNYSRQREKPECSSSAPLSKLSFHSPEEWQKLIL